MRCYTKEQCEQWLESRGRKKPDEETGLAKTSEKLEDLRAFTLAQWISGNLTYRSSVLLWITEWGIWPSSENWHLYYTLREINQDKRLLNEAPGHLFLPHEMEEFATVLQLSILNGWGGYILTDANYVNAFFSHDEFIDFYASEDANLATVRHWLQPAK